MTKINDEITMRDWFAGMALQGILASTDCQIDGDYKALDERIYKNWLKLNTEQAFSLADAMLKARGGEIILPKGVEEVEGV